MSDNGKATGAILPAYPIKISRNEYIRLSHQFMTDNPNAAVGSVVPYENRNHFYLVKVYDVGSYGFLVRIPLTEKNKEKINMIRKGHENE